MLLLSCVNTLYFRGGSSSAKVSHKPLGGREIGEITEMSNNLNVATQMILNSK